MRLVLGVVVTALAGLAWGGQTISWLAPEVAARWGLTEAESEVEPTFWADLRGEATWDALSLWTMVVAGALLTADHSWWPHFGLVGGGMFLYFAGRGISARVAMLRRGLRIGTLANVRVAMVFLGAWGLMAFGVVVGAIVELEA